MSASKPLNVEWRQDHADIWFALSSCPAHLYHHWNCHPQDLWKVLFLIHKSHLGRMKLFSCFYLPLSLWKMKNTRILGFSLASKESHSCPRELVYFVTFPIHDRWLARGGVSVPYVFGQGRFTSLWSLVFFDVWLDFVLIGRTKSQNGRFLQSQHAWTSLYAQQGEKIIPEETLEFNLLFIDFCVLRFVICV